MFRRAKIFQTFIPKEKQVHLAGHMCKGHIWVLQRSLFRDWWVFTHIYYLSVRLSLHAFNKHAYVRTYVQCRPHLYYYKLEEWKSWSLSGFIRQRKEGRSKKAVQFKRSAALLTANIIFRLWKTRSAVFRRTLLRSTTVGLASQVSVFPWRFSFFLPRSSFIQKWGERSKYFFLLLLSLLPLPNKEWIFFSKHE